MFDLHTIALLARAPTTSLAEAEDLIRAYAAVIASDAVAAAIEEAHLRTLAILNAPLGSEQTHAQA